jgi:hypothetical protein
LIFEARKRNRHEARRIAANIAKLLSQLGAAHTLTGYGLPVDFSKGRD